MVLSDRDLKAALKNKLLVIEPPPSRSVQVDGH